ncbi:tryptophan--tRNA ligase, mitochondrial [Schistocerca piceifrons]|uniref:tryptophan--tRNA ligase, mitochondrial n=1 Tax=Schistocerca piceifrons TaxID=274613 RepID=UPI001F5FCCBF|nr:tryptophan--tRNA ligase, mitochondrial [Schistocerca piceifrons]
MILTRNFVFKLICFRPYTVTVDKGQFYFTQCRLFASKKEPECPEQRVFSGIQPTGAIHLGNYFGAIQKWVELQDGGWKTIFSIVDHHAMTIPQDPKKLHSNIMELTATLLACGIDPKRSILFQQSMVPRHCELLWVISCNATVARLAHFPQYKEKSASLQEVPVGLYTYPLLQTADILLYKATHVPVGEDQVQHLQLTQHLAQRFNKRYGSTFPIPQVILTGGSSSKIRSLRNPSSKMSKSEVDVRGRLQLSDPPEVLRDKVRKAVTDCTSAVTFEPESRLGVANLIVMHSLSSGKSPEEICLAAQGLDTGRYKMVVADAIINKLQPIREKILYYMSRQNELIEILEEGSQKAAAIAEVTWNEVRSKIGIKIS